MKIIVSLLFLTLSTSVFSACLETSAEKMEVKFEAYKTPLKIGVGAKFSDIKLEKKAQGKDWKEATIGNTLTIDASNIDSGDKSRDKKISKFFFNNQKLTAVVTRVSEKKKQLTMTVTMNGKTLKKVRMNYNYGYNTLEATGFVDALDFKMSKNLKAINKACFAKHEGKTWSDVKISFKANFGRCKS